MEILTLVSFGLLGAIIGSFLNVVILRYNTGRGLHGRSGCFTCDKHLSWYELIPVVSYIAQWGKCRSCEGKISPQYPLVEFATALVFMLVASKVLAPFTGLYSIEQIVFLVLSLFSFSVLVAIFVYDLYHKIIPDLFALLFAIAGFFTYIVFNYQSLLFFPSILDFLAGPLLALPFYLLWKISKGTWIGLGDAKLVIGIGWFLGLTGGLSALAIGFWSGALVAVILMLFPKLLPKKYRVSWKSEIAFGPFLIIGTLIVYLIPLDFFHIDTFLYFLV